GGREIFHVGILRQASRTDRPAVDAGTANCGKEASIETRVAREPCTLASRAAQETFSMLGIECHTHARSLTDTVANNSGFRTSKPDRENAMTSLLLLGLATAPLDDSQLARVIDF